MIKSIKHKALKNYWQKGETKGLNAKSVPRINRILTALDSATEPEDMNLPGYYFHGLTGDKKRAYSVRVTANFRIVFGWEGQDAINVNLEDYH